MQMHQWSWRAAALPALGLLAMLPYSAAVAQTTYTVTTFSGPVPPFGHQSNGTGINANGDISGNDSFDTSGFQAALMKAGKETQLTYDAIGDCSPVLQNLNECNAVVLDQALALNDKDQVVGWGWRITGGDERQRPLQWQTGQTFGQDLGFLTGCSDGVFAQAINNLGQIVGLASNCGGALPNRAWLFQNGTLTTLPTLGGVSSAAFGINDQGQVVGKSALDPNANIVHAFVWQLGTGMIDLGVLSGGQFSEAVAINRNGVAVGVSTFNGGTFFSGDRHAVVFRNGQVIDLTPNLTSGFDSFAAAVNSNGQVVGGSQNHAFVWVNGVGTDLNTVIPPGSGMTLISADGINDRGQIVATAIPTGAGSRNRTSNVLLLTPN